MSEMKQTKVIFAGIHNLGKSSILKFLNKVLSLGNDYSPTSKEEITTHSIKLLGLKMTIWELGGQLVYRREYHKHKDKYLSSVSLLVFVIDIQDDFRHRKALKYLKELLNSLSEVDHEEKKIRIIILFNKCDPNLNQNEKYKKKSEELKKEILGFSPMKSISFYKTSIYDNLSLITFFSEAAIKLKGKPQIIQNILTEYCGKTFASAAMIFDKNFLVVDKHSTKEIYFDIIQVVAQYFINGIEKLKNRSIETIDIVSEIVFPVSDSNYSEKKAIILIHELDIETPIYLVVLSQNPKTKKRAHEYLDDLADNLSKVLETPIYS